MSNTEMRYWPRLGIYVTKVDAESYIQKVGSGHTYADDDLEEFVPAQSPEPEAIRIEVEELFSKPPVEAPEPSDEVKLMLKVIEFEQERVALIKKWIKEDGMEKQDAKDRFQAEMDLMVREALGLPEETEYEKEHREKAARIREEQANATNEEE